MIIVLLIGFMLLGWFVQSKLKRKFKLYSEIPVDSGLSGREIAEKMLGDHGISDVQVVSVPGKLSDHYNPANKTVNLSPDVYNGRSIAAAAVATHECGHAVQHATAYTWLQMRSKMVPVVAISSKLLNVIFFMAIFGMFAFSFNINFVAYILIGAQAVITLFSLVTLPVEYDASRRALVWLERTSMSSRENHDKAKDALNWAARTYVVSAMAAVTTLLYYIAMFTGRD